MVGKNPMSASWKKVNGKNDKIDSFMLANEPDYQMKITSSQGNLFKRTKKHISYGLLISIAVSQILLPIVSMLLLTLSISQALQNFLQGLNYISRTGALHPPALFLSKT